MITKAAAKASARKANQTKKERNPHPCLCEVCQLARIKSGYVGARSACAYIDDEKMKKTVEKKVELCYGGWMKQIKEAKV